MKHTPLMLLLTLAALFCTHCKKDKNGTPNIPFEDLTPIPHFYITMDIDVDDIQREEYATATLRIDGKDDFDDFEGSIRIRGRGNSTWNMPKKPYRIKLDSETSLLGMAEAKDWVLLAEYIEGSMLCNSIPFEMAKILEIPYTNTVTPVNVTINGGYRGIYTFTEHKEVKEGRIDIGDDGVLLEMDSYYDEVWKFKSAAYNLPVMIQFPKEDDMTEAMLNTIQTDFEQFENLIHDESFPNNNYLDYFDDRAFVDYMLVYTLTLNTEFNHPKSTYINKLKDGKYRMGIIWDFDWGYGYIYGTHFDISSANSPTLYDDEDPNPGTLFFGRLMEDPAILSLFKERWQWFRANGFEQVKDNVRWWSECISQAVPYDHAIWGSRGSSENSEADLQRVLNWLDARANYMDAYVSDF